ncbi:MAG TPA: hypothetical protein VKE25_11795 [Actinomycetes bacterium]|nr:hypothetical protein [Actinomycetes bacterium]
MRSRSWLASLAAVLALAPSAVWASPAAAGPGGDPLVITVEPARQSAVIGDRVTIRAQVTNRAATPTDPLIAHLNVASLTGTYVDLEDWTAGPTQQVAPIGAGASANLSWDIQAVNTGSFDVYVVLLPNGAGSAGAGPLVTGAPSHLTVAGRRTLNAGGSLPIVIAMPLLLGALALAVRLRRRRS